MKKTIMSGSIRCSILLAGILGMAHAAPYGADGHQTRWTQPNGAVVQLRVFGDEYYGRTETPEGYTVVLDGKTYYYAILSRDGNSLIPSTTRADLPAPADLAQHLDLPKAAIGGLRQANHLKYDGDRAARWNAKVKAVRAVRDGAKAGGMSKAAAQAKAAPFIGNKKGLTILVQFPNDKNTAGPDPIDFPVSRSKIVRYCNEEGYVDNGNTGSVRDFFYDQSLGKLTYTQSVTQVITLPKARNYYNWADYPANTIHRADAGRVLLIDALKVLQDQNFDFSNLSVDAGTRAYATNIFFAGPDSGVWSQGLWPHQWNLLTPVNVGTTANPILISNYQITNIEDSAPVIGTFCHENGHLILDYPDLYDYDSPSEGVGDHCLMGGGSYNNGGRTPSPINAYFKDIAGWGNVTDIAPSQFKTVNLATTGNQAYRLSKPNEPTEYFIVENRGKGDKWAEYSVDKGIAIWHIDETVSGNNNEQMTEGLHYQVSLEQADGLFQLEAGRNRGDKNDLFDLITPTFNSNTLPDSKWWDGTDSQIEVKVLTGVGASTRVLLGSVPPDTILLDTPNGGETLFPGSTYPVTWRGNITGNVRIELMKGGALYSLIAPNEENDGNYNWKLAESLPKGDDYAVRIRSVTNTVPAVVTSLTSFEVTNATFPNDGEMPYGWFKPKSADRGWTVSKSQTYEGKRSLASKSLSDGAVAGIAYRSNFRAGQVGFYMKASTEGQFDHGRFYIDGVLRTLNGLKGLSGETEWLYFTFPVSAGTHTFMWTYEKDDTYGEAEDSVWIDGVSLPPGTQEISVRKPVDVEHVDGETTQHFAETAAGSSSEWQTYTIKNVGKAHLTGITLKLKGENAADFVIKQPAKKNLPGGATTTFKVKFAPKKSGIRTAGLRILSNDSDEGNFAIALQGSALGVPVIGVSLPADTPLTDNSGVTNFGFAVVKTTGKTRTFTIRNSGEATLSGLSISRGGLNKGDFQVGPLGSTSLAPGASTTFKVTFHPKKKNARRAVLHLASNDKQAGVFDINVSGTGAPKKKGKSVALAAAAPSSSFGIVEAVLGKQSTVDTTTTVEVIGGAKYLSLTVAKTGGVSPGTVEVSSNLLDWYSGTKHTTILVDDATTLKVRDNTPVTPESKRYIQLK